MLDSRTVDKIKHVANTEYVRRALIKYFMDKGFTESFDRHLYPALLQDLPIILPFLASKVEVRPYAEEIDTAVGKAVLGWNLFVLGNQRMYLGDTHHNDLMTLARQIREGIILPGPISSARRQTTPKRVISFITRVLGDHESGYIDLMPAQHTPREPGSNYRHRNAMVGMPQQFFTRSGGMG